MHHDSPLLKGGTPHSGTQHLGTSIGAAATCASSCSGASPVGRLQLPSHFVHFSRLPWHQSLCTTAFFAVHHSAPLLKGGRPHSEIQHRGTKSLQSPLHSAHFSESSWHSSVFTAAVSKL